MQPALYTVETVRDIRTRAMHGQRLHELARYLGWDVERLRNIARKHEIHITDGGGPKQLAEPLAPPIAAPATIAPSQRLTQLSATQAKRPAKRHVPEHVPRRHCGALKDHPRNQYTTVALSAAAFAAFEKESVKIGRSLSGTIAIVADHIGRSKDISKFVLAAFKELYP